MLPVRRSNWDINSPSFKSIRLYLRNILVALSVTVFGEMVGGGNSRYWCAGGAGGG